MEFQLVTNASSYEELLRHQGPEPPCSCGIEVDISSQQIYPEACQNCHMHSFGYCGSEHKLGHCPPFSETWEILFLTAKLKITQVSHPFVTMAKQ